MKRRTRIGWKILIVLLVLVASAIVTVRILVRPAATDFIDFAELKRRPSRDDALACPPEFLCSAKVDLVIAPVPISAAALVARIKQLPTLEPRTVMVGENDTDLRYVLVQRSALLDLPDTINIAIQPLDAAHAAIAIYSRSRYGFGDLGVNRARVQRWLDLLGVAVVS